LVFAAFKEFSENDGKENTENSKYKYVSVDTELASHILKNGNDNKRQGKAEKNKRKGQQLYNSQRECQYKRKLVGFHLNYSLEAMRPIVPLNEESTSLGTNTIFEFVPLDSS